MSSGNYNMDDPSKQEQIRRGPHEYIPTAGKHGSYASKPYVHQEFPKMMGKWPRPQQKDFVAAGKAGDVVLQEYEAAVRAWDQAMSGSVVNNKTEERAWLAEHAG